MFGIGMQEILVLLVIALVVIGPKKLPEMAKALGKGYGEFRRAFEDMRNSINVDMKTDEEKERLREIKERVQPPADSKPSVEATPGPDAPSGMVESDSRDAAEASVPGTPENQAGRVSSEPPDTLPHHGTDDEEIEGGGD